MGNIPRLDGVQIKLPPTVKDPKGGLKGALAGGRVYVTKGKIWNFTSVPVRLANEGLFYLMGKANALPIPNSAVIHMNDEEYWGTEYVEDWNEFSKMGVEPTAQQMFMVEEAFKLSESERKSYLRAILLDVALLNSDRTPWNILSNSKGRMTSFRYFDHDRSFGWHGDHNPDYLAELSVSSMEINAYLKCPSFNRAAFKSSSKEELVSVFNALSLDIGILRSAKADLPAGWITDAAFEKMTGLLESWWGHLRAYFAESIADKILALNA